MSQNSKDKQKKRVTKQQKMVRILCLILAIIMFLGVATTVIYYLTTIIRADENSAQTEVINTSSLKDSEDVLISVGLMYGDNITTSFQIESEAGYEVGIVDLEGDRSFKRIWDLWDTTYSVMADGNISKTGMTYYFTPYSEYPMLGGYHVQIDCDDLSEDELATLIYATQNYLWQMGMYAIPSYIHTGYAIRAGHFATWNDAAEYVEIIQTIYPDRYVSVVQPKDTAVSVVNPYTDVIAFEFDCGASMEFGIQAKTRADGNAYIKTPAGNVYDGVFCFKRYSNGTVDGVSLINILPLECYIAGVLPSEITNTWPIEVQREFAITVRSFTLTHIHKHSYFGFDLCNTTDCQVYKGAGRVNDTVMEAVTGTKGKVVTYQGDIVTAYYSSSMGGVTVSPSDAWGGNQEVPYLRAIETPWEDYEAHHNGFWITEATPESIYECLVRAGYTDLKGPVDDIKITEFAKNSTYVKKLLLTDIYGNQLEIVNTDRIRISLSAFLNSANFVVGRGSVEYETRKPYDSLAGKTPEQTGTDAPTDTDPEETEKPDDTPKDKSYGYIDLDTYVVATSSSTERAYRSSTVRVITGGGEIEHNKRDVFVISKDNAEAFLGADKLNFLKDYQSERSEDLTSEGSGTGNESTSGEGSAQESGSTETSTAATPTAIIRKTEYAENPNNFIFVGKGWGHGVGISQYGSYDLAMMGYKAEDILLAYFVGADIINYHSSNNFRN